MNRKAETAAPRPTEWTTRTVLTVSQKKDTYGALIPTKKVTFSQIEGKIRKSRVE